MTQKLIIIAFSILCTLIRLDNSYALDVSTHRRLNSSIAEQTLNGFSLDIYLKEQSKILPNGIRQILIDNKNVQQWTELGGEFEDIPVWYMIYRRSVNHFHNPLRPLGDAGFTGIWGTYILSGKSAILWSQSQPGSQTPGGFYSWHDVRNYYYNALTSANKNTRDTNFADTFRGLGQLMHLVQDMSVPEHARDDGHYANAYEEWVRDRPFILSNALSNPIFFDMASLMNPSPFDADAPVPIARLFDSDQYDRTNPNPQVTMQNNIGLSEYTNANFLSPDTIFTDNLPTTSSKYFPYPKRSSAVLWLDTTNNRNYLKKTGDGEPINHLATCGLICKNMLTYFPQSNSTLAVSLDDKCKEEYASKLIPRAIGYSAGLLNYFFRGSIDIFPDPNGTSSYFIKNNSNETLSGTFRLYYDDINENRIPIPGAYWSLPTINPNEQSAVSFTPPTDSTQKNPSVYMLVFQGQMGLEQGAVIGKTKVNLPLPPPAPVSPLEGGYIYGPDHDDGLVWNPVSGGNGYYEVSIDGGNPVPVAYTKYSDVLGLSQGSHTWTVRTQNSAGTAGPWSTPITFTKYNYLDAPANISPLTLNEYDYPLLDWSPVTGAAGYYVYIYEAKDGVFKASTNLDYFATRPWQSRLSLNNGVVHWDVEARDARGVVGSRSSLGAWTQAYALAAPTPIQPTSGQTVSSTYTFKWHSVQGTDHYRITIDDVTSTTNDTQYTTTLASGSHNWMVQAVSATGAFGEPWLSSITFNVEAPKPCNSTTTSGGAGITTNQYDLGKNIGTFTLSWEAYDVPDQFDVIYQGTVIYTTGMVSHAYSHNISYSGSSSVITIRVTGGGPVTEWVYTVGCP